MIKTAKMTAVVLAMAMAALTGAALAAEQAGGDIQTNIAVLMNGSSKPEEVDAAIQALVKANSADSAEGIPAILNRLNGNRVRRLEGLHRVAAEKALLAIVNEMGKRGSAAEKTMPHLLSAVMHEGAVGEAAKDALLKMGPVAIGPALEVIKNSVADDMTMQLGVRGDKAITCYRLLKQMDAAFKGNKVLSALEAALDDRVNAAQKAAMEAGKAGTAKATLDGEAKIEMAKREKEFRAEEQKAYHQWIMLVDSMAMLGDKAIPALTQALSHEFHEDLLAIKIGPAAAKAAGRMIGRDDENARDWEFYYSLALAVEPDKDLCKPLIDWMDKDEHCMVNYIGMVLDRMAPASIQPLATRLAEREGDWYGRWAAAKTLELMGPKAKEAVPALETALKDEQEDLDVRIAAAGALARINGVDPFTLYKRIPDVEKRILDVCKDKSMAWREAYTKQEGGDYDPEKRKDWDGIAWWVHAMVSGENMEHARRAMLGCAKQGSIGAFMDVNFVRVFVMCHSKSKFPCAGRLNPELEGAMKEYFFKKLIGSYFHRTPFNAENLTNRKYMIVGTNHNIAMNYMTRDYLALAILKDDPEYRNRKIKDDKRDDGETVIQRYDAFDAYFKVFLKHWGLNGLWMEHASSNYEYHTYASYFNLADLSPDPEVRQLATMFLDLALIEAEQITISNQRGGGKSRAKRGGLGSTFNPYRGLLYGERGNVLCHAQVSTSKYQAPPAAVLMHKLGPTVPTFEIENRHAGGADNEGQLSRAIHFAYRTPEYVIGAVTFDPNRKSSGSTGRWSGVIFRNLSAISMDGYTGEKWCVQDKDVMIAQRATGHGYPGWPKIIFEGGFGKVEKDGWIFVDNGEAFAAVKVPGGGFWAEPIKRVYYLEDQLSPIIFQTGMLKDYGSFEKFQKAILQAPLKVADNKVEYKGPNSATLEFICITPAAFEAGKLKEREYDAKLAPALREASGNLWKEINAKLEIEGKQPQEYHREDVKAESIEMARKTLGVEPFSPGYTLPTVNGKTIDLDTEYNYRSPYLESKVGSDVVTVRYGAHRWDYDFGKNTITEIKK